MMAAPTFTKRVLSHPDLGSVPRSMPLIIPDDTSYDVATNELKRIEGKKRTSLKIVPETLRLLESINHPLAVLAIGGPCRTGKSYVLSRVLGSADDFALGHTFDAKTFGIWIGTTVLKSDEFTVLLMDTEGIDAANAQARDDASILVMTVLLSSYFIYNSIGVPHHSDLEKMSYFAKLATSIIVKNAPGEKGSLFDLKQFFPDFVWLLRDVFLRPTGDHGEVITPTEYLVSKVLRRGESARDTKANEIAKAILTLFPTIESETIQMPSCDPNVLRDIAKQQDSLSPAFNEQIERFVNHVLQRLQPKRGVMACDFVDGPMLAAMTTQYIEAVNDPNAIPCITDTWNAALEKRCKDVLDELSAEYKKEMETKIGEVGLPLEEESLYLVDTARPSTLFGIHRSILLKKTDTLIKQVGHFVGSPVEDSAKSSMLDKENLIAELQHRTAVFKEEPIDIGIEGQHVKKTRVVGGILLEFSQQNYRESRSYCLALFDKLYELINHKVKNDSESYSFEDLCDDLRKLKADYFREAVGPAQWEVYSEKRDFINSQQKAYSALKGFQKEAFEAAKKAAEESAKAAQAIDTLHKLEIQMRNDAELNQKRFEAMQTKHEEKMKKLKDDAAEQLEKDRKKYEDLQKANMKKMAEESKKHAKDLKEQQNILLTEMKTKDDQSKAQIATLRGTVSQLTEAIRNRPPDWKFIDYMRVGGLGGAVLGGPVGGLMGAVGGAVVGGVVEGVKAIGRFFKSIF